MSDPLKTDNTEPEATVTPFAVVQIVLTLFIGVGAVLAVLTVFGLFAWLSLWALLLKLAMATGILIAAILVIGWLMRVRR